MFFRSVAAALNIGSREGTLPGAFVVLSACVAVRSGLCILAVRGDLADESILLALGGLLLLASIPLAWLPWRWPSVACRILALAFAFKYCAAPMCESAFYLGRFVPLADGWLAEIDRWLGFDWRAYTLFFDTHPSLYPWLEAAYRSAGPQGCFLVAVLGLSGGENRAYALIAANSVALTTTMVVTLFVPAYGAYEHFGAAAFLHNLSFGDMDGMTAPLQAIRSGLPAPAGSVALVQFPSFHTEMAIIYAWAAWRSMLRWPFLIVNAVMLVSTPIGGSHYLTDMIGGAAVAILSIVTIRHVTAWARAHIDAVPEEPLPAGAVPGLASA